MSLQTAQARLAPHASGENGHAAAILDFVPEYQNDPSLTPHLFSDLNAKQKVIVMGAWFVSRNESTAEFFAAKRSTVASVFNDIDLESDDIEGHIVTLGDELTAKRNEAQDLANRYGETAKKVSGRVLDLITDDLQTALAYDAPKLAIENIQSSISKLQSLLDGVKLRAYEQAGELISK